MSTASTISESDIRGLKLLHRGKVRDVYRSTASDCSSSRDRISAFDCILPTLIPHKGRVQRSSRHFGSPSCPKSSQITLSPPIWTLCEIVRSHEDVARRSTLAKRTEVFPVECVVRGYLEGSGWKDYQATGKICGHDLPAGMQQCDRLPEPIFTPASKAAAGHDENIDFARFEEIIGEDNANFLREKSLEIYQRASEYALSRGIIVADTKFEFGRDADGNILLIDEVLTPDSSRFWSAETYEPGHAQPSFDKQFVREYLETLDWNKQPPAPELPPEVAFATTERYLSAYKLLTGKELDLS
jgi:phosphoribosylaminoimidazole-succinocarboxamide synthase